MGIGLYSLSVMKQVGMDRMDREILTLGEGHLATRPPRDYWQNFAASLRFIYGEERSKNLIVQIRDPFNEILFKSPHWPPEITEASFPDFDRTMDARPPASDSRNSRNQENEQNVRHDPTAEKEIAAHKGAALRDNRHVRPGPPPEAYKACEGKNEGSTAQFIDRRGETLKGLCEKEDGKMVLRPDANRGDRLRQAQEETVDRQSPHSSEIDQREWPMPRMKKKPSFATIQTSSGVWRTGIVGSDRITMMVGVNMADFYKDADRYHRAFLSIVPIALLLLGGGGWLIARRALRPVALITRTAEGMTVRALDQRVPQINGDSELSRLVEVINDMLDRLEKSFSQAVRFSANAAHELQTPLTILQGELDNAVQHAPVGSEEQQRYSGLLEEVQRLKAIIQKLLILARADAGRLNLRLEPMDLSAVMETAAEDASAMAPHLYIEKQILPGVIVKADPDLMEQVIGNLTSNAVKYNHRKGFIKFQLTIEDNKALVTIFNTGVTIPEADREKIFDRFYRVDSSRSSKVSGTGLGLSLAKEIVSAHHGDLRLNPDSGDRISFTLSLPCSSC